jgi:hypothetical protein
VRAPGGEVLSIKVERLEHRAEASAPALAAAAAPLTAGTPKPKVEAADTALPLKIGAHIRARGDMNFVAAPWAGRVAPGLWIESFSIRPLERFDAQDIEYKGLTGSGFETPWMSDDKMCGTKGMSVPLVGFAVRMKPTAQAADYDCEYSGYFKSGVTIGPLRNGAPCRSTVANDPLEGIQVRICKRPGQSKPAAAVHRGVKPPSAPPPEPQSPESRAKGPSFGRYRDTNGHGPKPAPATNGTHKPSKAEAGVKRAAAASTKAEGGKSASQRPPTRRS